MINKHKLEYNNIDVSEKDFYQIWGVHNEYVAFEVMYVKEGANNVEEDALKSDIYVYNLKNNIYRKLGTVNMGFGSYNNGMENGVVYFSDEVGIVHFYKVGIDEEIWQRDSRGLKDVKVYDDIVYFIAETDGQYALYYKKVNSEGIVKKQDLSKAAFLIVGKQRGATNLYCLSYDEKSEILYETFLDR